MISSQIIVDVALNVNRIPENITWMATESTANTPQKATAMMINFWDPQDKAAMRIDLWTKEMMVNEMVDFYYQTMMGMADTFERSTNQDALATEMREFAHQFYKKFQEEQVKNNK